MKFFKNPKFSLESVDEKDILTVSIGPNDEETSSAHYKDDGTGSGTKTQTDIPGLGGLV